MKAIKNWTEFVNENTSVLETEVVSEKAVVAENPEITEVQKEVHKEEKEMKTNYREHYQKFFHDKLKKFGAKGLGELGDRRGEFFKEIKSEWAKHKSTIK